VRAIPDDLALVSDLKHTTGAWNQSHFAEIYLEGREELLNQPSRTEQPLTLRAVGDTDSGTRRIHRSSIKDLHRLSDG
jgi:hypothetical protein